MTLLRITNGTTTLNLIWDSAANRSYMLQRDGWAPAVAGRRRSALGGNELYVPVAEELDVYAMGATAAEALANAEALATLLDQAERWWANQEVLSPVVLQYTPTGGVQNNQAVILGRADGDQTNGVTFETTFNAQLNAYMIDIRMRFLRKPFWSDALDTASAAAAANPSVRSISLSPAAGTPMPVEIDLTGFTTGAGGEIEIPAGYIAIGPVGFASLQQGETTSSRSLATSATFASTADATARASGGNVGRLNHNLTPAGLESSLHWTLPAGFLNARRIRVMLTYRNNAAIVWNAHLQARRGAYYATTPTKQIAAGPNNPTVYVFDDLTSPYGFDEIRVFLGTVSGTGTPTFDIDTILVVDLTDPTAVILAQNGIGGGAALGASFGSTNAQITVQHDPLTLLVPQLRLDIPSVAGGVFPLDYGGDIGLHQIGSGIDVVWYATHLYAGTTPYWTTQNLAGSAILSIGATAKRRRSTLTPK